MNYLNLGCGTRFHTLWSNVDFISTSKGVIAHDLRKGIPFQDSYFDVVYHSHLLEHFPKKAALQFILECHRVLKPGGVIRVAVPDLERIASLYLQALEKASSGDEYWKHNYDWIMLEMYDQTVREYPGGEMGKYLEQETISNKQFIIDRIGIEGKGSLKTLKQADHPPGHFLTSGILI
jgi:predicted SAM-dependent methyltransferase